VDLIHADAQHDDKRIFGVFLDEQFELFERDVRLVAVRSLVTMLGTRLRISMQNKS
jgi:hypothetical protein